jgi:hypothetical protein
VAVDQVVVTDGIVAVFPELLADMAADIAGASHDED